MRHADKLLTIAAAILFALVFGLWTFWFVYRPIVEGRWLFVISIVGGGFFWAALKEVARRKAESIDYRRR